MPVKYRKQAQKAVDQYQGTAWLLYAFAVLFFIPVLVHLISGEFFNTLLSAGAFIGMLIAAAMLICAPLLMAFMLPESYADSAHLVPWLCLIMSLKFHSELLNKTFVLYTDVIYIVNYTL